MKSNYKRIGDYLRLVDERNTDLRVTTLLGLTIEKEFMPSVANIIGTDLAKYKIIRQHQFACSLMQVRRDQKIPVALLKDIAEAIISPAYPVFEVIDREQLLPEYLMMWMSRTEFDREACFYAVGGVRGSLEWDDFCNMTLPVPDIATQRAIVNEYHTIVNRIRLNEQLTKKLEETAQAIYKHWFVDFEFPDEHGNPYKSSGGEMVASELGEIPKGWEVLSLCKICSKIGSGSTPKGGKFSYKESGIALIRSLNVYDYTFSFDDLAFIDESQARKLENVEIQPQDVLLNITGVSVARCCIVPQSILPARVNQHVLIIRPKPQIGSSYYLLCVLCSNEYKSKLLGMSQAGSTREAITKTGIENFAIILPDKGRRDEFERKMESVFGYREVLNRQSQCLSKVRDLLLARIARSKFDTVGNMK